MKCDFCGKEFEIGNRPDGLPNGYGMVLENDIKIDVCAECMISNEPEDFEVLLDRLKDDLL